MRVRELAKSLGWPSSQLIATLKERGEYVKSAMSKIESPVVREILRDFAADVSTAAEDLADNVIEPDMYGRSAAGTGAADGGLSFGAELARIQSQPRRPSGKMQRQQSWMAPILRVLIDEMIVPRRPEHVGEPDGDYFAWEIRKAKDLHRQWTEACLNGLAGDDATVINWIRLSEDGERPILAAEFSQAGITADEAGLRLSYGRPDPRRDTIFQRFRDGHLSRSEAMAEVRLWRRQNYAVG